jgi:hypothetical protein
MDTKSRSENANQNMGLATTCQLAEEEEVHEEKKTGKPNCADGTSWRSEVLNGQ